MSGINRIINGGIMKTRSGRGKQKSKVLKNVSTESGRGKEKSKVLKNVLTESGRGKEKSKVLKNVLTGVGTAAKFTKDIGTLSVPVFLMYCFLNEFTEPEEKDINAPK